MKRILFQWAVAAILTICGLPWLTSCTDNTDNPSGGSADYSTTLFVATDRHETGKGNNLTAMLARAVAGSGIRPQTVLLGGDYVGGMSDMTPVFSIRDVYDEVYAIVDPLNFTYANAGYLKLGRASVITFTDTDRNGHYDRMELRRYCLEA